MRRSLVIGNWKMHGSKGSVSELLAGLKAGLDGVVGQVVVCPPYLFIAQAAEALADSAIQWGGQNLSEHADGAFTGDVSASMLAEAGCQFVIVGHSERRLLSAESDEQVAAKFAAAQEAGLTPILCVGESLQQRESGEALDWIEKQLQVVVSGVGIEAFASAVVAYEPVWAIGTGRTASPKQAQQVHAHIRQILAGLSSSVAEGLQILYGGSVKADNAAELFAKEDIDGALVGGASLKVADFTAICRAAV